MLDLMKSASTPIVWVLALIALGLILAKCLRKRWAPRLGWFLVFSGLLLLYVFSIAPVAKLLTWSLERRYRLPSHQEMSTLDMVIILGGGLEDSGGFRESAEASGITYSRLVSGVRIFKRSGARKLILSGGGSPDSAESEAGVMKDLACEMGVEESRIVTEQESYNTIEQAVRLAELLSGAKDRRIGLVTSALHMLRSEKAFRSKFPEDTIVPVPVNYLYKPPRWRVECIIPSVKALSASTCAVHEWIGLIWYSIRD